MCAPCLEMQKPRDTMPDREALCPDCGKAFGDGPILSPAGSAPYAPGSPEEEATRGAGGFDYVKDLHSWAGWLIFWSIINTGSLFVGGGVEEELPELTASEMAIGFGVGCFLVAIGLLVLVSAIVCLATNPPWPGFYIIFGVYLITIGLLNLTGGGCWTALGIFQLLIAIGTFINYGRYLKVHKSMREVY